MRILAIGDIHGCLVAFDTLLNVVAPTSNDWIITLGDYVDRGPDSRGVIDRLLELRSTGRLIPLRGNHDVMMVQARDGVDPALWLSAGGKETLASYGVHIRNKVFGFDAVPEAHWKFLEEDLANWHETDKYIFVHAAVDPDLTMEEQDEYALHWQKVYLPLDHCSGKVIVCGHTKQYGGLPAHLGSTICIDTGAYERQGWLTCLDVESEVYWQANQRGERRTGRLEEPE
jgi:serine/threonine protein phosphatase 1